MTPNPRPVEPEVPSLSSLLWRMTVGLVVLMGVAALLAWTLSEPIEALAALFIESFGVGGFFATVLVLDVVPFTTHEPALLLAWAGGFSFWYVWFVGGTASVLSGVLGWGLGRLLGRWQRLQDLLERWRIGPFLRRHGVLAVALGALTPFPYALTTWGAGACGVPFGTLLLGALFRYPKVLFYLSIMVFGWKATGS